MEPDFTLIDAVETGDDETVVAWFDLNPSLMKQKLWLERLANAAIGQDQATILSLLIDRGVNENYRMQGGSLLYLATSGNHPDCVRLLLSKGADPSIRDDLDLPPLYYAAIRNMEPGIISDLLIKTNPIDLNTAVVLGDLDLIRNVLNSKAGSINGSPQPAKLLKDAIWQQIAPPIIGKVKPEKRPTQEIIKILLRAGADPNACYGTHLPPLFDAVSASNFDPAIIELLIRSGADITYQSSIGESLWDYAQTAAQPQTLELLRNAYRQRGIELG
jgi:ankyrin repeat protein